MKNCLISIAVAVFALPLAAQVTIDDVDLLGAINSPELAPQASGFDAAIQPESPESTINRADFWKLVGFLISPETFEDKGGRTAVVLSPTTRLSFTLAGQEPKLRQKLQDALDADSESELLKPLDLTDDLSLEGKVKIYPLGKDNVSQLLNSYVRRATVLGDTGKLEELARSFRHPEEVRLVAESAALLARQNTLLAEVSRLEAEGELARASGNIAEAEEKGAAAVRVREEAERTRAESRSVSERVLQIRSENLDRDPVLKALRAVVRESADSLNALRLGYRNNLQVHTTVRHRFADDLVAPDENFFGATAQWGFPRLSRSETVDGAIRWLETNKDVRPHSFAVEIGLTDKDDVHFVANPDLDEAGAREIKVSGNWTTKFARGLLTVNGVKVGADHSFTFNYFDTDREGAPTRFVVSEALVFHLTDNISFPISISYANRQEFLDADVIQGKVGLSFSLDNKNAGGGT